jgi:predicted NUDIX family NTP pyrophosphohydrolase
MTLSWIKRLSPARPEMPLQPLATIRQRGGKRVIALVGQGDLETEAIRCAIRLGVASEERPAAAVSRDRPADWLTLPDARLKILPSKSPLLDSLEEIAESPSASGRG